MSIGHTYRPPGLAQLELRPQRLRRLFAEPLEGLLVPRHVVARGRPALLREPQALLRR